MKFTTSTEDLRDTIGRLSDLPGSKSVLPIIRISADMGGVTLTRITPEATLRASIPDAAVGAEGDAEVGFGSFSQLIGRAGAKSIEIEDVGDRLIIKSGAAKMSLLKIADGSMVEERSPDGEGRSIQLPAMDLLAYLRVASGAASKDTADTALMGVSARTMFGGRLHFWATNRRVVHMIETPFEMEIDAMIPNETVSAIRSAFSGVEAMVSVAFHDNGVRVISERVELFSALSEAKPPNVEAMLTHVFNADQDRRIEVERERMIEALRTVTPVASGDSSAIDIKLERGEIVIEASNRSDAEIVLRVDATTDGGGEVRLGAGYLADALSHATGDDVEIIHSGSAVYIREMDRAFTIGTMQKGK